MTESHAGESGDDARAAPDRGAPPRPPRWVVVFGIVALVVVVVVAVMLLTGGNHGPGRHVGQSHSTTALVEAAAPSPSGRGPLA